MPIRCASARLLLLRHGSALQLHACGAQRPNVDYDADEVDVHGGDATVDDLMDAFGF